MRGRLLANTLPETRFRKSALIVQSWERSDRAHLIVGSLPLTVSAALSV